MSYTFPPEYAIELKITQQTNILVEAEMGAGVGRDGGRLQIQSILTFKQNFQ
jgi:hypothetical protein